MRIALSELKVNVGKYVDLAETEDVIITKCGKPAAKIIRFDKEPGGPQTALDKDR